jgi:hypothetical protein
MQPHEAWLLKNYDSATVGTARAAMVGAMIMARFSDDPKLSDELLAQTRAWIASAATSRGRTVTQ